MVIYVKMAFRNARMHGLTSPLLRPLASEKRPTTLSKGKPSPGFCEPGWGQACWFSAVSGIDTVVPSMILTLRPLIQPSSLWTWRSRVQAI